MDEKTEKLFEALEKHVRFTTRPVAVKLAKAGETPPEKTRYPVKDAGHRMAVCQGMTAARTFGWSMAFGKEDHACPMPRVFMGHIDPGKFLNGTAAGYYQDRPETMREMEASYPRWPVGAYGEIWLSPMDRCAFVPDLAVAYGMPAQVLALIQAANFRLGPGIRSTSSGRYGCSLWIAGVAQSGACTYMVPGPGERIFAGTQDAEMSFAVPYAHFDRVAEGLAYVHGHGAYRYPVPNLGVLAEPRIPPKYFEIE